MTFFILLILVALPAGREVYTPAAKITMPIAIEDKNEMEVDTPWGKAHATDYSTTDPNKNIYFSFTTYNFYKEQKIDVDLLIKAPEYYLLHKKCTGKIAKQPPLADSDGQLWPQITFEGYCVSAYSDFRLLVLIANNHVYQFNVGYLPYPKNPKLINKKYLETALKELLSQFSISKTITPNYGVQPDAAEPHR